MVKDSKIEWTDHTFNPWLGCSKVSPGCDHCYAEEWAKRYGTVSWGPGAARKLTSDSNWAQPLKWNKEAEASGVRKRVFCASLADVFDNEVDPIWREKLWHLISITPSLDWLLLTKRVGNIKKMLPFGWGSGWRNVWLGISVVNQEEATRDIPKLIEVPARVRFLSMEPLLGEVDLFSDSLIYHSCPNCDEGSRVEPDTNANGCRKCDGTGIGEEVAIDWVIVGGESGHGARPMHPQWVRSMRNQCAVEKVAFLFKQWGEWAPYDRGSSNAYNLEFPNSLDEPMQRFGKKRAGRLLDGRTWDEVPV